MKKNKRFHIAPDGLFKQHGVDSDKSVEWLEESYRIDDSFGRIECPVCHSMKLTILDIQCANCGTFVAKNRQPLDKDGTAKLAGGMKAGELMTRAHRWWDKDARKYFQRTRNRPGDTISRTPQAAKSGIFMGKKFDTLTRAEKFAVCKAYYQAWYAEEHTPKPDIGAIVL